MQQRVYIISIDSLTYQDYLQLRQYPAFGALTNNGSLVEEVNSPFPSLTYPCHATLMTGCHPDRTQVFHNLAYPSNSWNWYRNAIQVPTLLDLARKENITTACICWPGSGAADCDYLIAEIWAEKPGDDPTAVFTTANSQKAMPIFERNKHLLDWMRTPGFDHFATACTVDIIRQARPELLFSHLSYLDHQKHQLGIKAGNLQHAYAFIDSCLSQIVKATQEEDLFDETLFVLLGDHGLKDIQKIFNINVALKEMGYYRSSSDWNIYGHYAGCSCQIYIQEMESQEAFIALKQLQDTYPEAVRSILTKQDCKALHLDGPFSFVLETQDGYSFGKGEESVFTSPQSKAFSMANHGYRSSDGPQATCILCDGKTNIQKEAEMVDIAPTILSLLDIEPADMDGSILEII